MMLKTLMTDDDEAHDDDVIHPFPLMTGSWKTEIPPSFPLTMFFFFSLSPGKSEAAQRQYVQSSLHLLIPKLV